MRYCKNEFNERQKKTLNAGYLEKEAYVNHSKIKLMIWVNIKHLSFIFALKDTAGQEQFHALNPIYYREAAGKLHCFA